MAFTGPDESVSSALKIFFFYYLYFKIFPYFLISFNGFFKTFDRGRGRENRI